MKLKMKKKSKLVIITGMILKGVILPIKADCPTPEHYNSLQQNLKQSEYIYNYEKRNNLPTNHHNYDSFIQHL